ncbi:cysteine peptidase family C39 domain-containing protein [Salinactinospora qingdaonensis]|uniref:Uncharacterized protein n=1 Tax=Salinactinospora qingdaonensis TaxID=702744 RepID=A0ABP7FI71_9ACTN
MPPETSGGGRVALYPYIRLEEGMLEEHPATFALILHNERDGHEYVVMLGVVVGEVIISYRPGIGVRLVRDWESVEAFAKERARGFAYRIHWYDPGYVAEDEEIRTRC